MSSFKLKIDDQSPKYFHPGRSASLKLGKVNIAYFGQLIHCFEGLNFKNDCFA